MFVLMVNQKFVPTGVQQSASLPDGNPILQDTLSAHDPASLLALANPHLHVDDQTVGSLGAPSKLDASVCAALAKPGEKVLDRGERHKAMLAPHPPTPSTIADP